MMQVTEQTDYILFADSLSADNIFNNSGIVLIKYRTPVNGYNVDAIWYPNEEYLAGYAILRFHDGERSFAVLHECFFPSESFASKIEQDTALSMSRLYVLDYEEGNYEWHDVFKGYAPFFFADVNFDGKKDLILNYRRQGQRHTNMYRAYLADSPFEPYNTDLLYRQTEKLPFVKFDDLTKFDFEKKEIILHGSGGAFNWEDEYYRLNNYNEFELYKIIEQQDDKIYEYEISKRKISERKAD
jgi:hypothetical protein